ncbi:MAG: ATP-binding protein [Gemmataceae bacterium]
MSQHPANPISPGESRFRELVEKTADGVLVLRPDGVIAYCNHSAAAMLDRPAEELMGAMFGQPLTHGECAEIDLAPHRPGEPLQVAELRAVKVEWEGAPALLATLRDISARKQMAEAMGFLAEASKELARSLNSETILATLARLAVHHLADWCVIDLLQTPVADDIQVRRYAVGQPRLDKEALAPALNGHFSLPSSASCGLARVLRTRWLQVFPAPVESEIQALALHPDQGAVVRELSCRSFMIVPMTAHGRTLGAITFVDSQSGRSYGVNEQTLGQNLADRAALALENARLFDEAREALRYRDQFLAMLAHELRNPLAPILAAAEAMRLSDSLSSNHEFQRSMIERQGRHLTRLLDDLLDLSRISHGRVQLQITPIDLIEVIRDAVEVARPLLTERNHELHQRLDLPEVVVNGDGTRLAQVVGNLLTNAARYTEPGGRIEVHLACELGVACLAVRDNGRGIAPDMLQRIFEPFTQAHATLARTEGGLGLGLSIVRQLVELHGGSVRVESDGLGKGSLFEIRLPLSSDRLTPLKTRPSHRNGRRLLLVEDNLDSRRMMVDLLRLWGHEVVGVGDGPGALALLAEGGPDAVIIDIGLPGMDGFQLAQAIRRLPGGNGLLLVALTGYSQPEDRLKAREVGFNEYLVKPIDLDDLATVLDRHLVDGTASAPLP